MLRKSKSDWLKAGLAGASIGIALTWLLAFSCRSSGSNTCNQIGTAFDFVTAPARFALDPILRWASSALGVVRMGPDFVAAPPGVPKTLRILSFFALASYWFAIGTILYFLVGALRKVTLLAKRHVP